MIASDLPLHFTNIFKLKQEKINILKYFIVFFQQNTSQFGSKIVVFLSKNKKILSVIFFITERDRFSSFFCVNFFGNGFLATAFWPLVFGNWFLATTCWQQLIGICFLATVECAGTQFPRVSTPGGTNQRAIHLDTLHQATTTSGPSIWTIIQNKRCWHWPRVRIWYLLQCSRGHCFILQNLKVEETFYLSKKIVLINCRARNKRKLKQQNK